MKKESLIILTLILGLSFNSFAATGNANDGFQFLLVIISLLVIIVALLYGIDYLKKNGKTVIYKASSFLNKRAAILRNYLNKVKSEYFDISYF